MSNWHVGRPTKVKSDRWVESTQQGEQPEGSMHSNDGYTVQLGKRQYYVYAKWEYKSNMCKIKHYLKYANKVNGDKV